MDLELIGIIVSLVLCAWFAGAETVFLSFSKARLYAWRVSGAKGSEQVWHLLDRPERFMATTLIGNNLIGVLYSSLAAIWLTSQGVSSAIALLLVPLAILVVGEALPKALAQQLADHVILRVGIIIGWLRYPLWPLVRAVELFAEVSRLRTGTGGGHGSHRLSREEIVSLLTTSGRGDYRSSSGEMILKFFNLSDLRVSDIMTPRIAVVAVPDEFDLSEVRKAIVESGYTRLPVYHQNRENLVGLVMAKDLLQDAPDLKSVMRPLPMVPESMKAIRFLEWARRNHTGLAGVVDEYGGFAGVVGPEDLAQELVGAIRDEFDDQSGCIRLSARTWLVAGSTRITHLPANLEFELKGYKSRSIGGVVTEIAGTIPKTGKELNLGKFRLRVLRAGAKGVELVRITIPGSREESPSA